MGVNNKNAQDNIQLKGNKKPLQVLHISKKDTQKKSQDIDNEQTNSQEEIKKENIAIKPQIIKDESEKEIENNIKNIKIFDIRKSKNITFSHEPVNLENNKILNICGHYHPKIYLKNNGDKLSFRCFAMDKNKNTLFLPAFGDLTGGYPCKKSFKKWAIISEEEIIEIKS